MYENYAPASPNMAQPEKCEGCEQFIRARDSNSVFPFHRWHQTHPVERWLCVWCAEKDQLTTKSRWVGEFIPAGNNGK